MASSKDPESTILSNNSPPVTLNLGYPETTLARTLVLHEPSTLKKNAISLSAVYIQFKNKIQGCVRFEHFFNTNNLWEFSEQEEKKNKCYVTKIERRGTLGCFRTFKILTSSIKAFSLLVALDKMNFFLSIILIAYFSPVVLFTHNFTVAKFPLNFELC